MPGVWAKDGNDRWRPLTATGFVSEADLHSLIEQTPAMLPLAGTPTLAVVGKEVNCGRERADLLAIEIDTGRPVIIEVKLAANTDRRQALTQVLGLCRLLAPTRFGRS
jgi:RecB family endonuclease NucS